MLEYKSGARVRPAVVGGSGINISEHQLFVDQVLIPACGMLGVSASYPEPLGFESASRFGVGHANMRLNSEQVQSLVNNMRWVISSSEDLRIFKDFFFVAVNHGFKRRIPISNFDHLVSLALTCIDIEHPDFRLEYLHLDLGVTFLPPIALTEGCTGLWSDFDFTVRLLANTAPGGAFIGQSAFRIDSFCNFSNLGGFRFIQVDANICSISAYGLYKHPFFKRNNKSDRQGVEVTATDLYSHARGVASWKVSIIIISSMTR